MPSWIYKTVVLGLGRVLCMAKEMPKPPQPSKNQVSPAGQELQCTATDDLASHPTEQQSLYGGVNVRQIAGDVHRLVKAMDAEERDEEMRKLWKGAARILDRFFFILYLIVILTSEFSMSIKEM